MLMLLYTLVLPCSLAVSEWSQDKLRHECGLSRSSPGDKACISMMFAHFPWMTNSSWWQLLKTTAIYFVLYQTLFWSINHHQVKLPSELTVRAQASMCGSCKVLIQGKWGDPILCRGCRTGLSQHCSRAEVKGAVPASQEAGQRCFPALLPTVMCVRWTTCTGLPWKLPVGICFCITGIFPIFFWYRRNWPLMLTQQADEEIRMTWHHRWTAASHLFNPIVCLAKLLHS